MQAGPGNPAVRYRNYRRCPKGKRGKAVKGKGGKTVRRCVKVGAKKPKRGRGR